MDVVVKIEGRDALPVWTIPYVTDWDISPDMLLKRLVCPDYNDEENEPIFPGAFNLDSSGCSRALPSARWADVENRVSMLKDDLDAREDNETPQSEDLFDIWCTRSIDIIIKWAGCRYIWLTEFSEWLERYNNSDQIILMKQRSVTDSKTEFTEHRIELFLDPDLIHEHELHFKKTELGKINQEILDVQTIKKDGDTKTQFPWTDNYDEWLELSLEDQVKAKAGLDVSLLPPKPKYKRTTKLNDWLFEKWGEWDKPDAKHFASRLKPFQGTLGSPVKKYHGWNPDIVVEWVEGWGSPDGSWGSRTFQNKISDFRKVDKDVIDK